MLLLEGDNSDVIELVTDSAADIEVHASWADWDAGAISYGRTNTASITTATTTTIVGSPGATAVRNVRKLNIRNNHGANTTGIIVRHAAPNSNTLLSCSLLAGEALVLDEGGKWLHYTATGNVYPRGIDDFASSVDVEAGTDGQMPVNPGLLHRHPSMAKFWIKALGTGIVHTPSTGTLYNVTSVTDTGAGRLTVNIATDFSGAAYAVMCSIERTVTTLTVTNLKYPAIRNATQAAGSIGIECWDGTATTAVQEDPKAYHVAGYGDQ